MNKKLTPFFTCLFFALLCNTPLYAQKEVVVGKDMPLEINIIITGLQQYDPGNLDKFYNDLLSIDAAARSLSKEDIFMIGKIEVYKTFLKNNASVIRTPVDGNSITILRAALSKTNDTFISWFIGALLQDAIELTGSPQYKEFLLQKNNDIKLDKPEYKKLQKKGELLQFWITKINPEASDFPEPLKAILIPKMFDALKNIKNSFTLMAQQTSMSPLEAPVKDEKLLKFFTVREATGETKKAAKSAPEQKSVEDILAPITDPVSPKDLPKPSGENWTNDANAPSEMKNLPKPTNDAEWLQDF
jgi:hypothetical protein